VIRTPSYFPIKLRYSCSSGFCRLSELYVTLRDKVFALVLLALSACSICVSENAKAQDTDEDAKAITLRPNVVKITATISRDVGPQTGFGFIVGQQQNRLIVVTADHVVRGDTPGAEDKAPLITFFLNQGYQIRGVLEGVGLPKDRGDLAVILVENPGFATFVTDAIDSTRLKRKLPVWVIGRSGGWNIPVSPGVVAGVDPFTQRIQVESLAAGVGSSGGPLISSKGIVGMIVDDTGLYTEATPISAIQTQVQENWHYNWQLTTGSATSSLSSPRPSPFAPVNQATADAPGGVFLCKYERDLKSLSDTVSTNLVFRNTRRRDISLFWLNYQGRRIFYSTVRNGAQYTLPTYISHPWVVVDERGQCLELVLPGKSTATVDVE
jgi:Trypsin-like peptidase domain/VHL beta domain